MKYGQSRQKFRRLGELRYGDSLIWIVAYGSVELSASGNSRWDGYLAES
jgi:hypothetical protein